MSTSLILRPGVSLRRGADRHQTRIGWLHGRHSFDSGIDPLGADTHAWPSRMRRSFTFT